MLTQPAIYRDRDVSRMSALTFAKCREYTPVMAPTPTDITIERIRAFRKAAGWTIYRLGNEVGLNESTLRDLDSPDWNPRAETLRKLEAVIPAGWRPGDELPETPPHPGPLPVGEREKKGEAA